MKSARITFSQFILAGFVLSACGKMIIPASHSKEIIRPTGDDAHHYFGKIVLTRENRAFQDYYSDSQQPKFKISWRMAGEYKDIEISLASLQPGKEFVIDDVRVLRGSPIYLKIKVENQYFDDFQFDFEPQEQNFKLVIPAMKRLDIDDMLVTRQNKSTYFAPGTYSITSCEHINCLSFEEDKIVSDAKTKTGIDLVAGYVYFIEVKAVNEQGILLKQRWTKDLTK